jgi:hypothetical protein
MWGTKLPRAPANYTYRNILNKTNEVLRSYGDWFRKSLFVNEIKKIINMQSDELLGEFE